MVSGSKDDAFGGMDRVLSSREAFRSQILSLLAHPHLPILVSGSKTHSVCVWDLESRALLRTLPRHASAVWSLALDPAGRRLASGSGDETVKLWDLDSGVCLHTLDAIRNVFSVAWNWEGMLVASGLWGGKVCVWDAASGALRHTLTGHADTVWALAAHPTDDLLASGSEDTTVRVWRWSSGDCVRSLERHEGEVLSLAASAAWLVSGSWDRIVRVWSWTSGECVRVLDGFAESLTLNSLSMRDSRLVTLEAIENRVRVWDASSADPREWSCVGSLSSKASSSSGVAALDSGRVACTAPGDDKMIAVWEV